METATRAYFTAWNTHSASAVAACFTSTGTLRDWDVAVAGAEAVGEANGKIFAAVPGIHIEVLSVHVSETTHTATAEILVHLNDDAKTVLKVADVIQFDGAGKIEALRASKG